MKGKISKIKNMEDELVLPVTTVEAIYMEDGITKLSDEMKDVLKYEEFDNESVTTEIPSVKEEINGIKKNIGEINSSLEESVKFEIVGEGSTVPPINGGGSYVYDDTEIRELINETNASLDNKANKSEVDNNINELDVKIAENKTLTDSEISRLKEIANTWETFKNNGGNINGDIAIEKQLANLKIGDSFNIKTYDQNTELSSDWNKSIVLRIRSNASDSASYVRLNGANFAGNGNISLGEESTPWTNIYLNGMSKSSNGYTKLPNGFIIQWGHAYLGNDLGTGLICTSLSFPIQFPRDICHVYLTPCVNQYAIDGEYGSSWERPPVVYKITPSDFGFAFNRIQGHFGSEIRWFAIGY